jgi:hypothetical protein
MLALALFGFWAGRAHLGAVFREAVHPGREGGREYRLALVAVLAGLVVIGGWLYWAGFPGPVVPLVILLCFLTVIGLTRIVVQGGVGFMCSGMPPGAMAYSIAGPNVLGAQGVAAITTLYTWAFEFRTTVMASAAQGFRMLEACRTRIRIIPLAVALLIVLGISSVVTVRLAYQVGGANLRTNWFRGMAQTPYQVVSRKLNSPITSQMVERRWAAMGAGAAAMGTLMFCNWRFHWFPLHYIGFPIADVWMMNQIWASVFVAWLLKLLMLRYGGARAYSRSIALAIGLVFGQILVAALFMLVDSITGRVGNFVDVGLG